MAADTKKVIDFSDSFSAISLLKVSQVFAEMRSSEVLEIRGAEPDICQDLFRLLPQEAYEILPAEEGTTGEVESQVRIKKC